MASKGIFLNINFFILIFVYYFVFSLFDVCYLRIGAFVQLAILFILVLIFIIFRTNIKQYANIINEKTLLWSLISFIFLLLFILLIFLFIPEESIGWFIFLATISLLFTAIISLSSCFQNRIENKEFLSDSTEKMKYIFSHYSTLLIGSLIFFSPVILFIFLYALVYGSRYGFAVIEFFYIMKLNIFSFIPLLGLAFFRKTRPPIISQELLKKYKRIIILFSSIFLIIISSLIYPLIKTFRTTSDMQTTFNFFVFYVVLIGIIINIIYFYKIKKTSQYAKLYSISD